MQAEKSGTLLYYGGESAYQSYDTDEIFDVLESYIRGRVYYCDSLDNIETMVVTDYHVYIGYTDNEMYEAQGFYDEMGC